jgi:hypothetical protein
MVATSTMSRPWRNMRSLRSTLGNSTGICPVYRSIEAQNWSKLLTLEYTGCSVSD